MSTLIGYIHWLRAFSDFLFESCYPGKMESISRSIIIDYLAYVNKRFRGHKTKSNRIYILKMLFETGTVNEWFSVKSYLIQPEDYPQPTKSIPRFIPEEVMQQLNQHLDMLPEVVMRMTLVLQECGFRIG